MPELVLYGIRELTLDIEWRTLVQKESQSGGFDLLASSADCVMKKPTELAGILERCGFMMIFGSPPASSDLTSIASNSSFSLMKQSLKRILNQIKIINSCLKSPF